MEAQLSGQVESEDALVRWVDAGGLRGCHTVSAWHAQLTDRGARAIAKAPDGGDLEYVDLSWNHLGADGAGALAGSTRLSKLTRLRLYHNDLGAPGAAALARSGERLALLNVCGNQLGDRGLALLADGRLAQLRELALGWNGLGSVAVRALVAGPWRGLEKLNIRANRLGAADVGLLVSGGLPALRWLGIDENPLGEEGLAALIAGPGFSQLEWLNLGGIELDDRGLARLVEKIRADGPGALREIRVHDNELSDRAIAELRLVLPNCEVRI
jgi:hypothetical protein